jgi:hypothetical protein
MESSIFGASHSYLRRYFPRGEKNWKSLSSTLLQGHVKKKHCFREANGVAHHLARVSLDTNNLILLDGDPLVFLIQL